MSKPNDDVTLQRRMDDWLIKLGVTALAGGVSEMEGGTDAAPDAIEPPPVVLDDLEISPKPPTIIVGHQEQFIATGNYSDQTNQSLTEEVKWTSSNPAVVIDDNGLATAKAISPGVTITARDPKTGFSDSTLLKVIADPKAAPRVAEGPHLQFIQIQPPKAEAFVHDVISFRAIGDYADGSKMDLTSVVEWRSSMPGTVDIPLIKGTGSASVVNEGKAEITCREPKSGVPSSTAVVTAKWRVPPPPPPPPLPAAPDGGLLMEIQITPNQSLEVLLGVPLSFKATAVYNNGRTADWTTAVLWKSSHPEVLSVEPSGKAVIEEAGETEVSAHARTPIPAFRAVNDSYKNYIGGCRVKVLGPAPKTTIKVPEGGRLNKKVVQALVKNLVHLADAKFMVPERKALPKLTPTGDSSVDGLLKLAAEVVGLWNDLKTLAQARQIWQKIEPRLAAFLKEAEGPKVGVPRKELNPALDAMHNLSARVQSGPGNVSVSQRNTHPTGSAAYGGPIYVDTPYGELFYLRDFAKDFEWLTTPIVASITSGRQASASLQARLKAQPDELKPVAPFLKAPAAAAKEIQTIASDMAVTKAEISESTKNGLLHLKLSFEGMQNDVREAGALVGLAIDELDALDTREEAKRVRKQAEEEKARWDSIMEVLSDVVGATVDALENSVSGGVTRVFNLLVKLGAGVGESRLEALADQLEKETKEKEFKNAREKILLAQAKVADKTKLITNAQKLLGTFKEDYERQRNRAEAEYDRICDAQFPRFKFRFRHVVAALAAVEKTRVAAVSGEQSWNGLRVLVDMLVEEYGKNRSVRQRGSDSYEKATPGSPYNDVWKQNKPVTDAMSKDALASYVGSKRSREEMEALLEKLGQLRGAANEALVTAPERRARRR